MEYLKIQDVDHSCDLLTNAMAFNITDAFYLQNAVQAIRSEDHMVKLTSIQYTLLAGQQAD